MIFCAIDRSSGKRVESSLSPFEFLVDMRFPSRYNLSAKASVYTSILLSKMRKTICDRSMNLNCFLDT